MGQHLSEPETTKESRAMQNSQLMVGFSCMQGWRISMQSTHMHVLSQKEDPNSAFFGIYDGHGGSTIAQLVKNSLNKFITRQKEYQNGDIRKAIQEGFLELDNLMMKNKNVKAEQIGSTAVALLIKGDQCFCGNIGRSHAVACITGTYVKLSAAHEPSCPVELTRILNAGGWIHPTNFINGLLTVSRTFGDYEFKRNRSKLAKEQIIIALPDVEQKTLTKEWEFVLLASHGVWDAHDTPDIIQFVRVRLGAGMKPEQICEAILTESLASECPTNNRKSVNNMIVSLVCFLHGETWEMFCSRIAATPKTNIEPHNPAPSIGPVDVNLDPQVVYATLQSIDMTIELPVVPEDVLEFITEHDREQEK